MPNISIRAAISGSRCAAPTFTNSKNWMRASHLDSPRNLTNELNEARAYASLAYGDNNRIVLTGQYFDTWGSPQFRCGYQGLDRRNRLYPIHQQLLAGLAVVQCTDRAAIYLVRTVCRYQCRRFEQQYAVCLHLVGDVMKRGQRAERVAMKATLLGGAVASLLTVSAFAADLGIPPAQPQVVIPPFTWTSCYAGVQAGGGWGKKELTDNVGIFLLCRVRIFVGKS